MSWAACVPSVDWVATGRGNFIATGDGFEVSFNPNTGLLISCFAGDQPDETAILFNGKFYILNGDFRKQYAEIIPRGVGACLAFFAEHPELHSSWSNQLEAGGAA